MAGNPFVAVADLTAFGIDTEGREEIAFQLIDSVVSAVRDAAGVPITRVTSEVVLPGTREQFLPLPGGPIRGVAEVLIDGRPVSDWKVRDGRLWRPAGWQGQSADVTVTWDHGLDRAPEDIVKLVCTFVAAGLNEAEEGAGERRGKSSIRIDDYQESFTRGDDEVVDLTELPDRVKRSLAARFGAGGASVTGTY